MSPAHSLSHGSERQPRLALRALTSAAALVAFASVALAHKVSTYTSTSVCNNANTGWTVTNTCTCTTTIGVNAPHLIQTGTEFTSPIPGLVPMVTITDQFGHPITVSGQVLTLVPSPAVTAKVTLERGTQSSAHAWAGFESNVTLDPSDADGTASTIYVVTFTWPVPVGPTGAVWCSNNSDDLYGTPVYDGFQLIPGNSGTPYCFGDGSGSACPCGNAGAAFNGCANSINPVGAHFGASGNPSIAADTLLFTASGMPNGSMIFFQGTQQQNGGAGAAFGDGLRCATGTVRRFKTKAIANNFAQYPVGSDVPIHTVGAVGGPGTLYYQGWYRNGNPTFCTLATHNLTNGHAVTWTL